MARFEFLSGPECDEVDATLAYGVHFTRGAAVEVSDAFAVRKLRGNRFFREVVDAPEPPPVDADGDGVSSRDELRAALDRLDVSYDKRWGVERLREVYAAHVGAAGA